MAWYDRIKQLIWFMIALTVLAIVAGCQNHQNTFSEADALPIVMVDTVPDGFILLSEARRLIRTKDEHVDFFIWKNSVGIIDRSRRIGSARSEYAFETSIQDTEFIVNLADGYTYVNWQTFLDFLEMLQISSDKKFLPSPAIAKEALPGN